MYGKFIVEGDKLVRELLTSRLKTEAIYELPGALQGISETGSQLFEVTEAELQKISTHESPNQCLAVAEIPQSPEDISIDAKEQGPFLVCDNLNDPGNAGTIIRTAEWFGLDKVFFSTTSADIYNPKVVSAAKGSLFRMACTYADLPALFAANRDIPVYGAFIEGENIYTTNLTTRSFILIGNEANGISSDLLPFISQKMSIPAFGRAESLNAAIATGIILSEFRRRK